MLTSVHVQISSMLGAVPSTERAGTNVQLTITSLWLKMSDLDSGQVQKLCRFLWCVCVCLSSCDLFGCSGVVLVQDVPEKKP